ncbi:MAG TPA: tandem-95 repeat protein, partial [Rhodospirillales bacterium]|nr:tandem-95 repeat protein [Rhodospirillales bacterium]
MPTTAPDIVLTPAGVAVTIDVLANDSGDSLTIVQHTQPAHGSLTLEADQTFTYLPDPGFAGVDGFTYTVEDAGGATATGTVTISVLAPNADPEPAPDDAATEAGLPVDIPLLANDSDPDEDPLELAALGTPAHGTVVQIAPGVVRYFPQTGFSGTDRFTYTVTDGRGGIATGTVTVAVARANRPPELPPRRLTALRDTPLTFDPLEGALDPDGDPLRLSGLGLPAHGRLRVESDGRLTYLPDAGFEGEDSFSLTVTDGHGGSATGEVRITVTRPNAPPVAAADAVTTAIDTPVSIDLFANDSDPDGDGLRLLALGLPAHGQLAHEGGGVVTYVPEAGFFGVDSFTYTLDDGRGGTASATVTVTVTA